MHYMLSSRVALGYSDENDDIEYYVVVDGEQYYQVSSDLYFKLEKADGLHPLDIDEELISELESLNIISNHRIQRSGIFNHFIILLVGSRADKFRKIAKIFNMLLPCLGIVSLLIGIVARTISDIVIPYNVHSYGYSLLTLYIVLFLTLVLHELAHFNAAVAYEQEVSDIGLLLLTVLPVGAYIRKDAMNDYEDMSFEERKKIKNKTFKLILLE